MSEMETPQMEEGPLPPQPIPHQSAWDKFLSGAGIAVLAGGTLFFLAVAAAGRTRGSTVSYHLKWEERQKIVQAETQRAMDEAAADQPAQGKAADRDPNVRPNGSE